MQYKTLLIVLNTYIWVKTFLGGDEATVRMAQISTPLVTTEKVLGSGLSFGIYFLPRCERACISFIPALAYIVNLIAWY